MGFAGNLQTVAEMFPQQLPGGCRQVARSIYAEMHAGFRKLRGAMPMNIRASLSGKGMNADAGHRSYRCDLAILPRALRRAG